MVLFGGSLIKYIHLNPVRPRNKRKPIAAERARELDRYRWSSHRQFAGIERHACAEWLSLESLRCFGQTKQLARSEYRSQLAEMFGRPVRSPWDQLRGGMVLGGEALWDRLRDLVASAGQDEEVRWIKRLAAQELSTAVDELVSEESDRRIQIWILVRLGGCRMTEVARDYDFRDGGGVHQVVRRLESRAGCDPALARELETLRRKVSSVKS